MKKKGLVMEQVARSGHVIKFEIDQTKIEKILRYKDKMGDKFPKYGIFVLSYNAALLIEKTISRIPTELKDAICEIFIFDDNSPDNTYKVAKEVLANGPWRTKLNIYKNPKNLRYGGNQKVGYRYAINKGIDYIIMLHGDGQYAPEYIPDLILPTLEEKKEVVFASRMAPGTTPLKGGMPLYKYVGNKILTKFENMILGTKLYEFHSGYRLYSKSVLEKIPFEENTNEFHFDTEIIIQCRALNITIHEVPIKTFYGDEECNVDGIRYALDVIKAVLSYRMHQLHIIRRGNFLVDFVSVYTRKFSPSSSHEKIIAAIDRSGKVLGVGEHVSLIRGELEKRSTELVYFDDITKLNESQHLREFDFVLLVEVLPKHIDTVATLRSIQKYIKPDGHLILSVPNIAIWIYRLSLLIGRFTYGPKGTLDRNHLRFFTKDTILWEINRAGLIVEQIQPTGFPFEVLFESIGKSKLLKLADKVYYIFANFWSKMFAYQFVIKCGISRLSAEEGEGRI